MHRPLITRNPLPLWHSFSMCTYEVLHAKITTSRVRGLAGFAWLHHCRKQEALRSGRREGWLEEIYTITTNDNDTDRSVPELASFITPSLTAANLSGLWR